MKLTDLPRHGFLPRPKPSQRHERTRTTDRCPDCRRGYVIHLCDDPEAVRYVCSRRCGWGA